MDGEAPRETTAHTPGEATGANDEPVAGSGWTTTKQAAKVLGVSRRSVQGYVRRGLLEAKEEGEGVNKRFSVSIDSLNALRERRKSEGASPEGFADPSPEDDVPANLVADAGEGLRHVVDRLEARTAEATELRVRLEITERAESTLREELAEERRLREEAERRAEDLERRLQEAPEGSEARSAPGVSQEGGQGAERPGFWRRLLGG